MDLYVKLYNLEKNTSEKVSVLGLGKEFLILKYICKMKN